MTPNLVGVSHLGFSVPRPGRDRSVLGRGARLQPVNDDPEFGFLFHQPRGWRSSSPTTAGRSGTSSTNTIRASTISPWPWPTRDPGAVAHYAGRAWCPHSGLVASDGGWHLNLRAPGNFPVELFVIAESFAASLGLDPAEPAVAGRH